MSEQKQDWAQCIDGIAGGFRAAQVLLTANQLGLFPLIGRNRLTIPDLCAAAGTDVRATRILCDALVAMGLLDKDGGAYFNTEAALQHLLPDSPVSKVAQLRHAGSLYARWAGLLQSVRTGRPVADEKLDVRKKEDKKAFAEAMADTARVSSVQLADRLDLSGVKSLLDVGGGPGVYAIEFARRYPSLQVVILDDEETLQVARDNVERAGMGRRVSLKAGDVFSAQLGGPYDFILVSNVIHIYSLEKNWELIDRCARALSSRGRIGIKDFFLDSDRTGPEWSNLFAVNMLVNTDGGDCYTVAEIEEGCRLAGLEIIESLQLTAQSQLLLAGKNSSSVS